MSRTRHAWRRRRGGVAALRALIILVPVIAGALAALAAVAVLPAASGLLPLLLWWAVVIGSALVTARLAEGTMRRMMPLEVLLRLSLQFPREVPSRLRTAVLANNSVALARRVAAARDRGFDSSEIEAAQLLLALLASLARHDPATRGHTERVRAYTDLLATELDLDEQEAGRLRWAALLHDIGKVRIASDVLNKKGTLDDGEWDLLRRHPVDGALLAAPLGDWLGDWALAIVQHHERFDGTGYPVGLAGADISVAGRMVAVTDAYEVMTARRSYKSAMTVVAARRELVQCAGTHFDPAMVRAFLAIPIPRLQRALAPLVSLVPLVVLEPVRRAADRLATTSAVAAGLVLMFLLGLLSPGPVTAPQPPGQRPGAAAPAAPGAPAAPDEPVTEAPDESPPAPVAQAVEIVPVAVLGVKRGQPAVTRQAAPRRTTPAPAPAAPVPAPLVAPPPPPPPAPVPVADRVVPPVAAPPAQSPPRTPVAARAGPGRSDDPTVPGHGATPPGQGGDVPGLGAPDGAAGRSQDPTVPGHAAGGPVAGGPPGSGSGGPPPVGGPAPGRA